MSQVHRQWLQEQATERPDWLDEPGGREEDGDQGQKAPVEMPLTKERKQ